MKTLVLWASALVVALPSFPLHGDADAPLPDDDPKAVALYQAVSKHDINEVKNQILSGAPVDGHVGRYKFTPLTNAAAADQLAILKCLLDYHASINLPDVEGSTALLHACWEDKTECALALIDAGADVSQGSQAGRTPLMYAAMHGDDQIVQDLIAHKVALDATCNQGSALFWAASSKHLSTVKLLVEAGANANAAAPNDHTLTLMGQAASNNDVEMIDYLAGHKVDVNALDPAGAAPLILAISWNATDAAMSLLAHGASPETPDKSGMTPLMLAAERGKIELVRTLINARANLDAADSHGETALTLAGDRGNTDIVQLLKDAGAKRTDVHIVDKPTTAPNPSPRQAFALGVAAIYSQRDGVNLGVLGSDRAPSDAKGMLKGSWNITDKASLLKELDDLRDSGHHASYHAIGLKLDQLTDDQFNQYVAAHANAAEKITAARASFRKWHERTGLAWDMCRSANLVSQGYAAGYLDEGEAWTRLTDIASAAQTAFKSWQEMSDNFLDGREIWDGKRDPRFEACAQLLLSDPNSPWKKCPWDTPFPAPKSATPSPAPASTNAAPN